MPKIVNRKGAATFTPKYMGVKRSNKLGIFEVKNRNSGLYLNWFPLTYSVSRTPKYTAKDPVGMNDSVQFYQGGETEIAFTVDFVAGAKDRSDILARMDLLASWTRNDGALSPPPLLILDFGQTTNDLDQASNNWILKTLPMSIRNFSPSTDYAPNELHADLVFILAPNKNVTRKNRTF